MADSYIVNDSCLRVQIKLSVHHVRFQFLFFFFNDTATTEIYTLSLHDALPIFNWRRLRTRRPKLGSTLPVGSVRDRKSGSAGMPRPISYAVFCLKKKKKTTRNRTSIKYEHGTNPMFFKCIFRQLSSCIMS